MSKSVKYFAAVSFALAIVISASVTSSYLTIANENNSANKAPGRYIVVFNDDVADPEASASEIARARRFEKLYTYKSALKGFAAAIPQVELESVKNDPRVKYVAEDKLVSIAQKPGGGNTQPAETVPTGISRISAADKDNNGTGVGVAVIDTGIYLSHPDLKANIAGGKNCSSGKSYNDGNGHGTHVAGTIAALDNEIGVVGVAPEASLYAVRVLDNAGNGTASSVICGIDWVTANADKIKIANMSLGGSGASDGNCGNTNNDPMHQAICKSRDAGVVYIVAAGNENDNAANHVPSAYNDAVITVSALVDTDGLTGGLGVATGYGTDDTFASFSNYGSAVDLGAPGVNILSTWKGGGYKSINGTSMATPHVTGAAALYVKNNPSATWEGVRNALTGSGEVDGHTDPSGKHPEPVVNAAGL